MAIAVGSANAAARAVKPSGRASSRDAGTVTYVANAPRNDRWSGGGRRRQTDGRPRTHARHSPQPGVGLATTVSPIDQPVTPSPRAATRPDHSWPSTEPGRA